MKRTIRALALIVASGTAIGSFFVHPYGPVKAHVSAKPLLAGAEADPAIFAVIQRSCQNCHSEKTDWPWYSYVAPASWLLESDVAQARSQMNLSHWDEYPVGKQQELLGRIGAVMKSNLMPPARFTAIHPSAKLSPVERELLYQWTKAERRRLKSMNPD